MRDWLALLLVLSPLVVVCVTVIYGGGTDIDFRSREIQDAYVARARRERQARGSAHDERPCVVTRFRTLVTGCPRYLTVRPAG